MSAATDDPFTMKGDADVVKAATDPDVTTTSPSEAKGSGSERNKAYNEAVAALKERNPSQWEDEYRKALEKRGLTYVVRLTAEERAEKEAAEAAAKAHEKIRALAKEHGFDVTFNGSEAKSPE